MVRFAVIGTNFITDNFMDAGSQCEGFKVQAVYSRSMERQKSMQRNMGSKTAMIPLMLWRLQKTSMQFTWHLPTRSMQDRV